MTEWPDRLSRCTSNAYKTEMSTYTYKIYTYIKKIPEITGQKTNKNAQVDTEKRFRVLQKKGRESQIPWAMSQKLART